MDTPEWLKEAEARVLRLVVSANAAVAASWRALEQSQRLVASSRQALDFLPDAPDIPPQLQRHGKGA
jgi:hypothetical protein